MQAVLAKKYEIKTQRIGQGKGKTAEGQVLNRVVRRTSAGFELEADLRHAELIVEQLGLQDAKEVSTPGLTCLPSVGEMPKEQKNKKKKGSLLPRLRSTEELQLAAITSNPTGLTSNMQSRNAVG
jgi:hypothetical protein